MKKVNKLVRDGVPEIIGDCKSKSVDDKRAIKLLCDKVVEEIKEFATDGYSKENLSDAMFAIVTITERLGYSLEELYEISERKFDEKGGYDNNTLLVEVAG